MDKTTIMTWVSKLLEQIVNGVEKAGNFMSDQLPIFVQEFLTFSAIWHWFWVIFLPVFAFIMWCVFRKWEKSLTSSYDPRGLPTTLGVLCILILLIPTFINLYWALMVTFAPRLFLVKELIQIVK